MQKRNNPVQAPATAPGAEGCKVSRRRLSERPKCNHGTQTMFVVILVLVELSIVLFILVQVEEHGDRRMGQTGRCPGVSVLDIYVDGR